MLDKTYKVCYIANFLLSNLDGQHTYRYEYICSFSNLSRSWQCYSSNRQSDNLESSIVTRDTLKLLENQRLKVVKVMTCLYMSTHPHTRLIPRWIDLFIRAGVGNTLLVYTRISFDQSTKGSRFSGFHYPQAHWKWKRNTATWGGDRNNKTYYCIWLINSTFLVSH